MTDTQSSLPPLDAEWLEADGLGGFAMGTAGGERTRRYHALVLAATRPPAGRMVLLNGFDAWVERPSGVFALSTQRYAPDVVHPDGHRRIAAFTWEPWPRWTYRLEDGTEIEHELFVPQGRPAAVLRWSLQGKPSGSSTLKLRPFLSGRDYHQVHRENGAFRFDAEVQGRRVTWRPYGGVPGVEARTNGTYTHEPVWYRNFLYAEEARRGLDCVEDLASPGVFRWDLAAGDAVLVAGVAGPEDATSGAADDPLELARKLRDSERRRRQRFASPLERAADAYVVERGKGKTIVAGYPWFTDWGRDTFIALRGLCLALERLDVVRGILLEWAGAISEGMLPNRFPDSGETPEYNSVDASLWYAVAVHEYLEVAVKQGKPAAAGVGKTLGAAVESILDGYSRGTRFGIHADRDGLIACGVPGVQLTWMDAKVGDWVVTPRIGKPVEVQALWINALRAAERFSARWPPLAAQALKSFEARFWNPELECLYDVVDVDHVPGKVDASVRPNQVLAAGGLPFALLSGERARKVVRVVQERLLSPLGLRSLAPGAPEYRPRYEGGPWERDGAYHQGTVWPWLLGPFVEAWLGARSDGVAAKDEARRLFVEPLRRHLEAAGLGHVSEIADAEAPHTPRGCPFQAWSLGELIRIEKLLLDRSKSAETSREGVKRA
jgi:predicted glycogen debranching enzyme